METIIEISYNDAVNFLLPRHYSGRKPVISKAFGLVEDGILKAVITYGKPASPSICKGLCGEKYSDSVYELNRMCRVEDYHKLLSHFVATTLRMLKPFNWIIVSYSDTAMNHHGYVYQACNFWELYTLVFIHYIKKIIFYENGKHRYRYHHDYYQTKLCKTNYHP